MMPYDFDNLKELLPTADVLYVYFTEANDALLSLIKPSQVLCVYAEATQDTTERWSLVKERLSRLAHLRNFKILVSPTDPYYAEMASEIGAVWFPNWLTPTFVLSFKPMKPKETFFVYYGAENVDKGKDVILGLIGKVPIVGIGVWEFSRGFIYLNETLWLQARSFSLLFPSRSDSAPRVLISAMLLEQVPIILRTIGAHFRTFTFGWKDYGFIEALPITNSVEEFHETAERAFRDPDAFMERFVDKMKAFMEKHREYWDPHVLWKKWKDMFGFTLPADLMPLHNIFWIGRDNIAQMPDGPWRQAKPSLNFRLK